MHFHMNNVPTKPDMASIRREGQAFLAEIESHGHVLPSLEDVDGIKPDSTIPESRTRQMAGFAEDQKPQVIRPK
jgi:hypothetical protein